MRQGENHDETFLPFRIGDRAALREWNSKFVLATGLATAFRQFVQKKEQ